MDTYTRRQEIVNGLTAAIGMLFGISGLPVLVGLATAHRQYTGYCRVWYLWLLFFTAVHQFNSLSFCTGAGGKADV